MQRRERTEILIEGSAELRRSLADAARASGARSLGAQAGLAMIRMRDAAQRTLFYLGEVLISEARADAGGVLGLGLVRGDRLAIAEELALIDAAWSAGTLDVASATARLRAESERLRRAAALELGRLAATRVDFETMAVEP